MLAVPAVAQDDSTPTSLECALWFGDTAPYTGFPDRQGIAEEVVRRGGDQIDYSTARRFEDGCPAGVYQLEPGPCNGIGDVCYRPVRVGAEEQSMPSASVLEAGLIRVCNGGPSYYQPFDVTPEEALAFRVNLVDTVQPLPDGSCPTAEDEAVGFDFDGLAASGAVQLIGICMPQYREVGTIEFDRINQSPNRQEPLVRADFTAYPNTGCAATEPQSSAGMRAQTVASSVSASPTNLPRTGAGSTAPSHTGALFLTASLLSLLAWRTTRTAR